MLELTKEQAEAVEMRKSPLHVLNPRTKEVYVLIRKDVYDLTCGIIGGKKDSVWNDEDADDLIRKKP